MSSYERIQEEITAEIQPTTLEFITSQGKKVEYEELMRRTGLTTMNDLLTAALSLLTSATGQAEVQRVLVSVPVGKMEEVRKLRVGAESFDSRATQFAFTASLARR